MASEDGGSRKIRQQEHSGPTGQSRDKVVTNRAYISRFIDVGRMGQELCLFEHMDMKSIMGDSSEG